MDLPDGADDSGMDLLDYVVEEIMDDVFKMVSKEEEEEEFVMDVNEKEEGQDAEEVKCPAGQSGQDRIVKQEGQDQIQQRECMSSQCEQEEREAGQQQEQEEEQENTEQEENQQTEEQHEVQPAQAEQFHQVQGEQAQLENQDPMTLCKDFEIRLQRITPTVLKNISSSCLADASKKRCLDSNCSKISSCSSSSSSNSKGSTRGRSPFHKDSSIKSSQRPGKFSRASLKKRLRTEKSPSQTAKRQSAPPALAKATSAKRLSCPWCFR